MIDLDAKVRAFVERKVPRNHIIRELEL